MGRMASAAWVAMLLVLSACSSDPSLSIELGSASLDVVRGAEREVAVAVAGGGGEPVHLSLHGAPPGVSASFDPATIDDGDAVSTLTLAIDREAVEGSTDVTVRATQGDRTATALLSVTVSSLTVDGTVVGALGERLEGVRVAIGGATTRTDADGRFAFSGVAVPYDLVAYRSGIQPLAHVFVGMKARQPEILPFVLVGHVPSHPSGTLQVTLPAAVPAGHTAVVCVEGVGDVAHGCDEVAAGGDAAEVRASWAEGAAADLRIHALEAEVSPDGVAQAFTGHGTALASVSEGAVTRAHVSGYSPPPSATTLSGTVDVPDGFALDGLDASARVSANLAMPIVEMASGASPSFAFQMPDFGEGTFHVVAQASGARDASSVAWRTNVVTPASVALPTPPELVGPADGADGVTTDTAFTIDGDDPAVHTFDFRPSALGPHFAVTTMADTVAIPELSAFDLALPSGARYTWRVLATPGVTSMEDAGTRWIEGYYRALVASSLGGAGAGSDGSIAVTPSRALTTE